MSAQFQIEIPALPEFINALDDLDKTEATRILSQTADVTIRSLIGPLAKYPPAPYGGKYRRTGTLGRGWTNAPVKVWGDSFQIQAIMGNAVPYAKYVQGRDFQPDYIAQNWQTVESVLDSRKLFIQQQFSNAVDRLIDMFSKRF